MNEQIKKRNEEILEKNKNKKKKQIQPGSGE